MTAGTGHTSHSADGPNRSTQAQVQMPRETPNRKRINPTFATGAEKPLFLASAAM
jgi:hypothetical protein